MKEAFHHSDLMRFGSIGLKDLAEVSLLDRTDLKFVFPIQGLKSLLKTLSDSYELLTIGGQSLFKYDNIYFDTIDLACYLAHHNGRANRFKLRKRQYVDSKLTYLEIKKKTNKSRTIKSRIEISSKDFHGSLNHAESAFVSANSSLEAHNLIESSRVSFKRITIAAKNRTDRATIDLNLRVSKESNAKDLSQFVIAELKQEQAAQKSIFIEVMKELRIRPFRISKYCLSQFFLSDSIKQNRFKPKKLALNKMLKDYAITVY